MSETTNEVGAVLPPAQFKDGGVVKRTDNRGRVLHVKQLSLMEEMNLIAVAGGSRAENRRWMMYATMVACVREINGIPSPFPATARDLEGKVELVGAEGVAVVAATIAAEMPDSGDDPEPSKAGELTSAEATAKN